MLARVFFLYLVSALFTQNASADTDVRPFKPVQNLISNNNEGNGSTNANIKCATGVHMIIARASTEPPGPGIIGLVANMVQDSVPGSDSESVDYPATLTDYRKSEASGVAGMQSLIESYASRCPESKIALMGYSQGAQVVGDIMCGTSEANFTATAPLSPGLSQKTIIQMGDSSHVPNLAQDVGNSTKAGVLPRIDTASCEASVPITQSYCDSDDKFCDAGTSIQVHLSYVQEYGTMAAKFIADKVGAT